MVIQRLIAIFAATIVCLLASSTVPAQAAPPPCDGVWVVVQPDEADPNSIQAGCAIEFSTGFDALEAAGFLVESAGSMVSRIDTLPEDADFNSNGGLYWSYWHTTMTADGALDQWSYYEVGADQSEPEQGRIEGWLLTNRQDATGPALTDLTTVVPEAEATPSASVAVSPTMTAPPASAPGEAPVGTILGIGTLVVAAAGLGTWWFAKGRTR